jgi:uncharacterized pyridoxamine 5'-phosphate oxidase family protein
MGSNFLQVVENRTWVSHALTDPVSVTADTEIAEITTIVENSDVSIVSLDAVFEDAGKLYYVDANGKSNYLTDPSQNYPAKKVILATFFLKKGDTVSLRYSGNTTLYHLYVVHGAGVF